MRIRRGFGAVVTMLLMGGLIAGSVAMSASSAGAATTGTISTIVGTGVATSTGDGGPATVATVNAPFGVAYDLAGNLYVGEFNGHRVRKVSPSGVITAFAGTGVQSSTGDGGPATSATIDTPWSLATDFAGNVYIADSNANKIRKVSPSGIITTFAGTGVQGDTGDDGPATAAQIHNPKGLAIDAQGRVLFTDGLNRIRRIGTDGIINTIAGTSNGFSGDGGPATAAKFQSPSFLAFDRNQNLLVSDTGNYRIRRIDHATGVVSTIAGNGTFADTGDGGPATSAALNVAYGLAVDGANNVFLSEESGNRVRRISASGTITAMAGTGVLGFGGDGGPATAAQLSHSYGLAIDPFGNLAIADGSNSRIRSVAGAANAGQGYYLAASDGGVFTHGSAVFYGSEGALKLAKPIVTMATTPIRLGYWLFASDGGVFTHGDAGFFGSEGALKLAQPIVAAATTPSGNGYWLFASDGGVFTHGDAAFYGSEGALKLNKPIVAAAATPTGKGYWLFASDGGVFTHGDAAFLGSEGALKLAQPIVSAASSPTGQGYWLFAADGGVFTHGDAAFYGSEGALKLARPIVASAATATGRGYWLFAGDGGVFTHGDAGFFGSEGALKLAQPIVAAAAS
jgi:sugar lactone lactonase YvrE